jgi:hypothetical protein
MAACSGGEAPAPAVSKQAAAPVQGAGEAEAVDAAEQPAAPEEPVRLVEGETDGELGAEAVEPGETEGAVAPPPGEEPPPVDDANQPAAPDADPGAVVDPNLDPEHLEKAREADMTEREKRAARARAARKAYEQ